MSDGDKVLLAIAWFVTLVVLVVIGTRTGREQGRRPLCNRALATASASDSLTLISEPFNCDINPRVSR